MLADYPNQTDLFTTFWNLAHLTWHRRATAKNAGMTFSEETISETLLLELATRNSSDITVVPFNKWQEGQNGADWEWCFHDPATRTFQRMIVQAKLLDDQEKGYSHIDRFIGSTGVRQIDRLLTTSTELGIPALYVFYNHLSDETRLPPTQHPCMACNHCWGCSAAPAPAVSLKLQAENSVAKAKSFDEIKLLSRPWLCLLCDCKSPSVPLPKRVLQTLQQLWELSRLELSGTHGEMPPLPEEPSVQQPPYFETLDQLRIAESAEQRDGIIANIRLECPHVDGILLVTKNSEPRHR